MLRNKNHNQFHDIILQKSGILSQLKENHHGELQENADMVSEGSQYGVTYYNQVQEE